jgi:hypothetical protein
MGIDKPDKINEGSQELESKSIDPLALLKESFKELGKAASAALPQMTIDDGRVHQNPAVGELARPTETPRPGDPPRAANGDKSERAADKMEFSMGSTPQRENLLNSIMNANDISAKEKNEMIRDIKALESRAVRDFVPRQEVLGVYENVSRLLDAKGNQPVSRENRIVLAEQVLEQAAHPMGIDQGQHLTCNVTTVEARIYSKYPSKAAALVADVALTGKFETENPRDNDVVLDRSSLKPDKEAANNPPKDGERSYASQIFQMTAANIHWQRRLFDPNGVGVARGELRYVQIEPINSEDTGERVRNSKGETLKIRDEDGKESKITEPFLDVGDLVSISNEITRKTETNFALANSAECFDCYVHGFKTEQEFAKVLKDEKSQYPLILMVHTYNEPFWKDSGHGGKGGAGGDMGGWHVVNVNSYNEKTGEVQISNQWGDKTDKKVSLSTLYKATFGPPKQK